MDGYDRFKKRVEEAAEELKKVNPDKPVRVISHIDADGISACSILIKALDHLNMSYSVTIVKQLNKGILYDLSHEAYDTYFFTDLGSGQLKSIKKLLGKKKIFILDHHKIEEEDSENIVHVNPELFDISGSKEISGAGVSYFFYRAATGKKDMAHIAVVGAVGDVQEDKGFRPLNDEILQDAIQENLIEVKKGLRFFGIQTRPLYKLLEYQTYPIIPGVSGSESGSIQFLNDLGINPKLGNKWKKLSQLSEREIRKLVDGIIMRRMGKDKPEDVIGSIYTLAKEKQDSPTRDAREYATLLNSCGRMDKASFGLACCLGDETSKLRAIAALKTYKKELSNSLKWLEKNKDSPDFIENDGYVIINAKESIRDTIIGVVASILTKNPTYKDGTLVLALARNIEDGTTKISLRVAGQPADVNLKEIVKLMSMSVGGEYGGHKMAAGGRIKQDQEEEFITNAQDILSKIAIEEKISN